MVQKISIKNFKSIKHLELDCKKLNVFIGEPNSGKSNIIEALSLLGQNVLNKEVFGSIIRFKQISELFYDLNHLQTIEINAGDLMAALKFNISNDGAIRNEFVLTVNKSQEATYFNHDGTMSSNHLNFETPFRVYEYKRLQSFNPHYFMHLNPPFGDNLPTLLLGNDEWKRWLAEFLRSKDLKLIIKPSANDIEIAKTGVDVEYNYPYLSLSDTLKRIVFYTLAMDSNRDKILLFDEPDTHTFPFNTKMLGESIALDETNQFFITTHSPYLLLSMIEKSSFHDINVCVTTMKEGSTIVTPLSPEQISKALDHYSSDIFLNLDNIIE